MLNSCIAFLAVCHDYKLEISTQLEVVVYKRKGVRHIYRYISQRNKMIYGTNHTVFVHMSDMFAYIDLRTLCVLKFLY